MGKVNGQFVIILNANRVLSVDEMAVLAGAGGMEVSSEGLGNL
jgi:hypothetical protein